MSIGFSKRVNRIVQSEIRAMSLECERLGGINLAQGVCDTEIPLSVRRAVQKAIDGGVNSYTRFDGLSELREVIARTGKDGVILARVDTEKAIKWGIGIGVSRFQGYVIDKLVKVIRGVKQH